MPYNWFHMGVIGGKFSLKTSGKSKKFSPKVRTSRLEVHWEQKPILERFGIRDG